MSTSEIDTVSINIMGRCFKIKCPQEKTSDLQKAADYLDSKMQEIVAGDNFISIDKAAVIAALNIAYELITQKHQAQKESAEFLQRITSLKNKMIDVTS